MKQKQTDDMPYEKFLRKGAESLTDAELLALLLRTGSPSSRQKALATGKCPAVLLAEEILALPDGGQKGLAGICSLTPAQLEQIKGVGEVKAVRICCISELARRIAMAERSKPPAFQDPASVAAYYRPLFSGEDSQVEKTVLVLLDGRGRLLREKVLSVGTVNAALVSPREVFLQALRHQAVSFLLLHNHPSGDVSPSRADADVTARLAELGDMMELSLLDHIIVSKERYFSFREAGLL